MIKKLFLDTETTTAEIGDGHIIEIGGIIEYGKTYKEFVLNAQPADFEYVLKEEATDKHGFSREDIDKFPTCQQAYGSLIEILEKHVDRYDKTDKFVMYGYGAEFDNQFLRKFFLENNDNFFGSWFWHPWVDVMSLAMNSLAEERHRIENFQLSTVAEYLGIEVEKEKLHGTRYDNYLCMEVFEKVDKGGMKEKTKGDIVSQKLGRAFKRSQRHEEVPF